MNDLVLVNSIMTHKDIYNKIRDDGSVGIDEWTAEPFLSNNRVYFLLAEQDKPAGLFMVVPMNSVTYDVHTMILPEYRGKDAVSFALEGINYMFENTRCLKLITYIPSFNRPAYALAKRTGMVEEGLVKKSFMYDGKLYDQNIMGICKEN